MASQLRNVPNLVSFSRFGAFSSPVRSVGFFYKLIEFQSLREKLGLAGEITANIEAIV